MCKTASKFDKEISKTGRLVHFPKVDWGADDAKGRWGTSFSPYIYSTSVLFYHLTYLVYLIVVHERMTLLPDKLY